jgi:hypothetical protein
MTRKYLITLNALLLVVVLVWGVFVATSGEGAGRWLVLLLVVLVGFVGIFLAFLWQKRLRFTALAFTLAWFLIAILGANAYLGRDKGGVFEPSVLLGWRVAANLKEATVETKYGTIHVSTDHNGARNEPAYREGDVIPYLVQGDSNLYGVHLEYEQTLAAQLNALSESSQFYNFGVPGYDMNQYYYQYAWLRDRNPVEGRIVFFNIGNDFTLSALAAVYGRKRPYLMVENGVVKEVTDNVSHVDRQAYGQRFIKTYCAYDHLIKSSFHRNWADRYPLWLIRIPLVQFMLERTTTFMYTVMQRWQPSNEEKLSTFYPSWILLKREFWPEPFLSYSNDFESILRQTKAQNDNLTIVLYPMRSQVVPKYMDRAVEDLLKKGHTREDIDRMAFNTHMAQLCKRNGIRLIDATPALVASSEPESLYQAGDKHLSARAMGIIADLIRRELAN